MRKVLSPIVNWLARISITPDCLTTAGFIIGIAALLASNFNIWLSLILFSVSFFMDALDGELARKTKETRFGAFIDSTLDRAVDFFFIYAFALRTGYFAILAPAFFLSVMISYTKHRAECLGAKVKHSVFDRAQRIIYLLMLIALNEFTSIATIPLIAVYMMLCLVAIAQIIIKVKRKLE